MKKIKSVQIWNNGIYKDAINFELNFISDNLIDNAIFSYYLYDKNNSFQSKQKTPGYSGVFVICAKNIL